MPVGNNFIKWDTDFCAVPFAFSLTISTHLQRLATFPPHLPMRLYVSSIVRFFCSILQSILISFEVLNDMIF